MSYAPVCKSRAIMNMQDTPCAVLAGHPYFITHPNGDHAMQDENRTKPDKTGQPLQMHPDLSPQQERAIDLLMQGRSDHAVAQAVNVRRQTVCDWRNHNPAFIAELNRRRQV